MSTRLGNALFSHWASKKKTILFIKNIYSLISLFVATSLFVKTIQHFDYLILQSKIKTILTKNITSINSSFFVFHNIKYKYQADL